MDRHSYSLKDGVYLEVYRDSSAPEANQPDLEAVQPGLEPSRDGEQRHNNAFGGSLYSGSNEDEKALRYRGTQEAESTICGLRKTTFWLTLALALVIILAAAIGGGVGGSMSANNSGASRGDSSGSSAQAATNSNPTANHTTITVTQQVATATPSSQCPDANLQNYTSDNPFYGSGLTYTKVCGVDLDSSVSKVNLARGTFQGFDACIAMCDSINQLGASEYEMNVIVWSWGGMGPGGMQPNGTCWCVAADEGYTLTKYPSEDAALLVGTFKESHLPNQ